MHYARNGEYLAASHVTGPRHNLLQMRLGRGEQQRPMCERLPPIGECRHDPIDEAALISSVLEGVAQANQRNNIDYCVTHIRYVENDTGPLVVFAMLASKIIEHLYAGGTFIEQATSVEVGNAL
jgi:hypothetical protein